MAALDRDTSDTLNALKPIFDQQQVEAGFAITAGFSQQTGQFLADQAAKADTLKAQAEKEEKAGNFAKAADLYQQSATAAEAWGPGSTNRQLLTAAASGNVTGSAGEMLKAGAVSYLQQNAAEVVGVLAHGGIIEEGSAAHVALHAIIGCAGAAAGGAGCSAGALGASASVVITSLLNATAGPLDPNDPEAAANAEARRNLVANLVTGLAAAGGIDATTAAAAALAEVDNNANKAGKPEETACGTLKVCLTGGTFKNEDGTVKIESSIVLRTLIPGQIAWDDARTNWANGQRGWAVINTAAGVGEQVLFIGTLGTNKVVGSVANSAVAQGSAPAPQIIYRSGSDTAMNMTPRLVDTAGLSATNSLENALPGKIQIIDTAKFTNLCAVCDNLATGHVSIAPKDIGLMEGWIASRGGSEVHPLTEELIKAIVGKVKR